MCFIGYLKLGRKLKTMSECDPNEKYLSLNNTMLIKKFYSEKVPKHSFSVLSSK